MKKNGFTLIELLAVILILGIIAVIAIPKIQGIIEKSSKNAFKVTAENITNAAIYSWSDNNADEEYYYIDGEKYSTSNENLKIKGKNPELGIVNVAENGNVAVALYNGEYCATKNGDSDIVIVEKKAASECSTYNVISTKDTWSDIATKYETTIEKLLDLNNETDSNSLTEGKDIKVPIVPVTDPIKVGATIIYLDKEEVYTYEVATTRLAVDDSDDGTAPIDLGFTFNFAGTNYTTIYPSTNGYITFSEDDAYEYDNSYIASWFGYPIIALYWTDLYFDFDLMPDSGIYYKTGFENGQNYILIEWRDVTDLNSDNQDITTTGNFEVKLYEDGTIKSYYKDVEFEGVDYSNGIDATFGVYVNDTNYNQYSYLDNSIASLTGLTYYLGAGSVSGHPCYAIDSKRGSIIGYNPNGAICTKSVTIPSKISNMSITKIADSAFEEIGLESLIIPNTITSIGESAFYGNNLTSIDIPSSISTIKNSAFSDNQISALVLPSGVTIIEDWAFSGNQIQSLNLPNTLTSIGSYAFYNNVLTEITINSTSTVINDSMLNNSNNHFRTAYLNGGDALYHGTQNGFWYKDGEPISCFVFDSNTKTIVDYNSTAPGCGTTVDIPSTIGSVAVEKIGNYVFNNKGITSLTISSGVTTIGNYAFSSNLLTSVVIPNTVVSIGTEAFANNQLNSLTLSNTLATIGTSAFKSNQLTSVSIPSTVTSLAGFENNQLSSITLPTGITIINDNAFQSNQLVNVTIPTGVTSIGQSAFHENQLVNVNLPNTLQSIGLGAFANNLITSVVIPNSVVSMERNVFYVNKITSLTIGTGITEIPFQTFAVNSLASVTIPSNITKIGLEAFYANKLTSISIPSSVTIIESGGFSTNKLTSLTIPATVTSLGTGVFSGNNTLTAITVNASNPNYKSQSNMLYSKDGTVLLQGVASSSNSILSSTITIGAGAYRGMGVTSVTIPNGVVTIENGAFGYNNISPLLVIPSSVRTIGDSAFSNAWLANGVSIANGVTSIGAAAFASNALTSITIPNSVTSIGASAFYWNYITQGNAKIDNTAGAVTIGSEAFSNNGAARTSVITPTYLR